MAVTSIGSVIFNGVSVPTQAHVVTNITVVGGVLHYNALSDGGANAGQSGILTYGYATNNTDAALHSSTGPGDGVAFQLDLSNGPNNWFPWACGVNSAADALGQMNANVRMDISHDWDNPTQRRISFTWNTPPIDANPNGTEDYLWNGGIDCGTYDPAVHKCFRMYLDTDGTWVLVSGPDFNSLKLLSGLVSGSEMHWTVENEGVDFDQAAIYAPSRTLKSIDMPAWWMDSGLTSANNGGASSGYAAVPVSRLTNDGVLDLQNMTEIPIESLKMVPWGYLSWDQVSAARPLFVAHRGGSGDWPEMSMRAYTNSVAWGAPVLELSCSPTVDGVWVAVHDANLNRTSQTTGLPNISTMTWAEVQQYRNTLLGYSEPYERIETILDRYSRSHAFFIDPKYGINPLSLLQTLFGILKDFPGWEKHVIKYFYDARSVADAARAASFHSWGYYYEADVAQAPTTAAYWDLLGLDYNASAATWTTLLSYGKPVLAHIVGSAANWTTALSKGASGAIVSGVTSVIPGSF